MANYSPLHLLEEISGLDERHLAHAMTFDGYHYGIIARWIVERELRDRDWRDEPNLDSDLCGRCKTDKHGDRFVVDHCHGCGRIRGYLCRGCNNHEAVGWNRDDRRWKNWRKRCARGGLYESRSWTMLDSDPRLCGSDDDLIRTLRAVALIVDPRRFESWPEV